VTQAARTAAETAETEPHQELGSAASPRLDLSTAAVAYRTAQAALEQAEQARTAALDDHRATMALVGRVRLGNGDPRTRKAHHTACTAVAAAGQALDHARDELVAAALEATAPLTRDLGAA